jgi:hypothetical protein
MATGAAVVGVGPNVDALSLTADFADRAQAAIATLTVLEPLVEKVHRVHLAGETRELQPGMVAEAGASGLPVEEQLLKGGIFAMSNVATRCSHTRSAE